MCLRQTTDQALAFKKLHVKSWPVWLTQGMIQVQYVDKQLAFLISQVSHCKFVLVAYKREKKVCRRLVGWIGSLQRKVASADSRKPLCVFWSGVSLSWYNVGSSWAGSQAELWEGGGGWGGKRWILCAFVCVCVHAARMNSIAAHLQS